MKPIVLIALLGLTSGVAVEKRHRHSHRPQHHKLVNFLDGSYHDDNDLSVPMKLLRKRNPTEKEEEPKKLGVRFVQTMSDPIHGSLGPPPSRVVEPTPELKLEMELRKYKPREFTHEVEAVKDTENSITVAEKLVGAKMAEPHDVEKRKAKAGKAEPVVKYTMHDSDDEDQDTIETRKSLKTA